MRSINADTQYFRELTKPQVDLVGSYSMAGLAGAQSVSGVNPLTSGFAPIIDRINQLSATSGLQAINLPASETPELLLGGSGQALGEFIRE